MNENRDTPIEPLEYVGGVKVVDIGDLRIARGMTRREASACRHVKMVYDMHERRIWCSDCEQNVEAFDAFRALVEHFDKANKDLKRRQEAMDEAESEELVSLAARQIDKAWRSRSMVPACPNCRGGLFSEDFKNGVAGSLGREYALALRKRNLEKKRT